jgi:hypothetical protein
MPLPEIEAEKENLNRPEVKEVIATRKDAVVGPTFTKRLLHLWQTLRKQGPLLTALEGFEQSTRLLTGAPTRRFSQITPNLHVGGQHNSRGWGQLSGRGVTAVVSLRGEIDDREQGVAPPRYLYLPTVDNHAPTLEDLKVGVDFISGELQNGGGVYIHCWEGVGRAPTMAVAYLVSTGLTTKEAWEKVRQIRPFIRPVESQIDQIERFAAACNGGPNAPQLSTLVEKSS